MSEVTCHVFGNSGQQGFRSETSYCLSYDPQPAASILLFQGCERSARNPEDNGTLDVAFAIISSLVVGEGPTVLLPNSAQKRRAASTTVSEGA